MMKALLFLITLLPGLLHAAPIFRAGVSAIDISPKTFPRIIAGGFLEGRGDKLADKLHVRSFVLDDGKMKIAFAIVDTCMMEQALIDEAKELASKQCGIPVDHMMVSATHTHSAPAAMGCLGTRKDSEYAKFLIPKIAEGIVTADKALQPARIGWGSVDDWEHTHNRRWIRLAGKEVVDPFGQPTGRANMHPGYLSKDVVGPSGPVDPQLSVISLQTLDGRPLGVLANYSQHYFGNGAVSSDYYGLFCKHLAAKMGQEGDGTGAFVCAMSQGTSGDLMWMDYGAEKKTITIDQYAAEVANSAMQAMQTVAYHDHVPLGMVEKTLQLSYRVPDEKRLAWARPIAAKIENDLPKNKEEVYAREALILHERQKTHVKLQVIRIGGLSITTLPNEVYAISGLKLKQVTPFEAHFNIGLANGAEGYIPPAEQHRLGGYTTWPARTAGLEERAESSMLLALANSLRDLAEGPAKTRSHSNGDYTREIMTSRPLAYQRCEAFHYPFDQGEDEMGTSWWLPAGAYATYLPGVGSGRDYGSDGALKPSPFSGESQINRSIHLAGAYFSLQWRQLLWSKAQHRSRPMPGQSTYALWFWLGHESGASDRTGELVNALGVSLKARQDAAHRVRLTLGVEESKQELFADDWHFAVLVRDGDSVRVHIDGAEKPGLEGKADVEGTDTDMLVFGKGLEGRLDEITIWDRALEPSLIARLWKISKVAEDNARHAIAREKRAGQAQKKPGT